MHPPMLRLTRAASPALPALLALAGACSDPAAPDGGVAAVVVSTRAGTLVAGDTLRVLAEARDRGGRPVGGVALAWQSSDELVATVTADGTVVGRTAGRAVIRARAAGFVDSSVVQVADAAVASVELAEGPALALARYDERQLAAVVRDARGRVLSGRAVAWTSADPGVVTVDGAGRLAAVRAGAANVVATSEGRSATVAVTVTAAPAVRIALSAGAMDVEVGEFTALGVALTDARDQPTQRPVAWTTSDSSVATVSVAGLVTALRLGTVVVTATSDGQTARATVRVGEAPAFDAVFSGRRSADNTWELLRLPLGTPAPRDPVRLAGPLLPDRPAPSPDGSRLAVTERLYDLWTGEPRGSVPVILTRTGTRLRQLDTRAGLEASELAWSPDGSRLAFTCGEPGRVERHICLVGANGGGFTELPAAGATTERSPSWSLDGTRLAYAASDGSGSAIWTMRADGTDRRRLTTLGGQNARPAWAPYGQAIAFEHYDPFTGESDVRVVPATGGAVTTLLAAASTGSTVVQPAWSPDGRFLAFVRWVDGAAELFTVRADGTALRRRTFGGAGRDVVGPAWIAR
jgi:uncharacterized protein YjdB